MARGRLSLFAIPLLHVITLGGTGCDAAAPDLREPATNEAAAPAAPRREQLGLDDATRAHLWEMEHHANLLNAHGFAALRAALARTDRDALLHAFSDPLEGALPAEAEEIARESTLLRATILRSTGQEPAAATREDVAGFLLQARHSFRDAPTISFGVRRIRPTDPAAPDGPWEVETAFAMRGDDVGGGPREFAAELRLRVRRPSPDMHDEPGWISGCTVGQVSWSAATQFLFEPVTESIGLRPTELHDNWASVSTLNVTGQLVACDYDRDGCTDVLVTDIRPGGNALYRGRPDGSFVNETLAVGLLAIRRPSAYVQSAFADLDDDGWVDLVRSDGEIWRNTEGRRFDLVGEASNLRELIGGADAAGITIADVDRDGLVDLYLVRSGGRPNSWLEDTTDSGNRNALLLNRGGWQFEDVTERAGCDGGARSTFSATWLDADGDRWPDVYVINEFGDGALYVNEEGRTFRAMDVDADTDDFGAMGVAAGDIDNDGNVDLYVAAMYSKAGSRVMGNLPQDAYPEPVRRRLERLISGSELYRNHGALRFEAAGRDAGVHAVGWAWGSTLTDFDNDGWLDVFATAGYISRDRSKPDG